MRAVKETIVEVTMHSRMLLQRDANLHMSNRAVLTFSRASNLQPAHRHLRVSARIQSVNLGAQQLRVV